MIGTSMSLESGVTLVVSKEGLLAWAEQLIEDMNSESALLCRNRTETTETHSRIRTLCM